MALRETDLQSYKAKIKHRDMYGANKRIHAQTKTVCYGKQAESATYRLQNLLLRNNFLLDSPTLSNENRSSFLMIDFLC
jgi:hypothetical protein